MVGEMLSAGLGCIGFSWASSPAATELETHMMDWLARLLALPEHFLNAAPGPGGGVLQGSASEATLVALLAAKERTVRRVLEEQPGEDAALLKTRLVAYTCDQANSSVEKAGLLASLSMRLLPSDAQGRLRADVLQRAVDEDRANGLLPCFLITGTALLCPEYRHIAEGAELTDSFCVNPHKWMLINFDCSAMWVRDSHQLVEAFTVDRIYLAHHKQGLAPDYRNWQIPLGRRFRALKLWLVLRLHGAEGLRAHVRHQVALARHFEALARAHAAVHVATVALGLVCFRLQGPEALTEELLAALRTRGRIYVVAGAAEGRLVIRFCICSRLTRAADVDFAWEEIRQQAEAVLRAHGLANGVTDDHTAADVNGQVNRLTKGIVNGVTVTNGFTKSDANGAAHGFTTSDSDADGAEPEIPMVADMVTSQPPLPSAECKAV
ncbi:3,4-dihydroxyphenylacetaldehyde synthase [Gryllus bimaculatus]|nr:3,4-dihydroxyphenylacetaldehyde synthase [Gryllus bimaculatus]